MDSKSIKIEINTLLGAEFGLCFIDPVNFPDDGADENWPFELEYVGNVDGVDYYRFDDFGDIYYASWSPELVCFDSAEQIDSSEVGPRIREMERR